MNPRLLETEIKHAIWDSDDLTPQQKLVLLALMRGQPFPKPFPGIPGLSSNTRIPPEEVTRIIRQFESAGVIIWEAPPDWTPDDDDCSYRIDEEKFSYLGGTNPL